MRRVCYWPRVALALALASVLIGCGASKSNEAETATATNVTPEAQATTAQQPTSASTSSGGSGGSPSDVPRYPGDQLRDVPAYPGAERIITGQYPGGPEGSIPAIGNLNAADYPNAALAIYVTSDSPQQVFDWYKDNMSGWTAAGSLSGGTDGNAGSAAWTRDNGNEAAWITVWEYTGNNSINIWCGRR